jgi:hypothetical protein
LESILILQKNAILAVLAIASVTAGSAARAATPPDVSAPSPPSSPAGVSSVLVDGDPWIPANALRSGENWVAPDPSHASFALWLNGRGYIPFEGNVAAAGFWVHRAGCPNLISGFSSLCGWDLGLGVTQWKSVVVGGSVVELDGNGLRPFGRVVSSSDGATHYIGIASNTFDDFRGSDVPQQPSWFVGMNVDGDTFQIKRRGPTPRGGTNSFHQLLEMNGNGNLNVGGAVAAGALTQSQPNRWAARAHLRRGRFRFVFPVPFHAIPVCVATGEGDSDAVLHVAPTSSACTVRSSSLADESVVDIVVVGNPD